MTNYSYITSEMSLPNLENNIISSNQELDKVWLLFEYFFTTDCSLKDQNKHLILFIQHHIQENDFTTLNRLFQDDGINDLHVSLLKSASIFTSNIENLRNEKEKLDLLVKEKLS